MINSKMCTESTKVKSANVHAEEPWVVTAILNVSLFLHSPLSPQVLDAGKIHAYDAPYNLLQDTDGIFYKMVQQTGKQEAAALLEAAKQVSIHFLLL